LFALWTASNMVRNIFNNQYIADNLITSFFINF
jgi:hypothetical protein